METRNKATEEKPQTESNQPALPSTTWLWNPFGYFWGNSSPPIEAQPVAEELSPHVNAQEEADDLSPVILQGAYLLPQQNLIEQQQAIRPAEEQKQLEEILAQQEATAVSSPNISNMIGLLEPLNSTVTANSSNTTSNVLPDNTDNTCVSFVFRSIPPSPTAVPADPHPAQDTAEEDAAIARATELSISTPTLIPLAVTPSDTDDTMEKTNTDDEEEATSEVGVQKTIRETVIQQSLIAQIAKLQSDNMQLTQQLEQLRQENARKLEENPKPVQKEEELERSKKNLEVQEAARQQEEKQKAEKVRELKERQRVNEEKARQEAKAAVLLQREQEQRRAEAQAAEERKKAEEAFSRSCSTGARTLEEHYRLARAAVARAGF